MLIDISEENCVVVTAVN